MEVSVRYIPTDRHPKLGWSGNKPALCFFDDSAVHCLINDEECIHLIDLPTEVVASSRPVELNGVSYPVERFVSRLQSCGKPMSSEAVKLLRVLRGEELGPEEVVVSAPIKKHGRPSGTTLIAKLSSELKIPAPKMRRFLRAKGLRAPYEDEAQVRSALKDYEEKTDGKGKKPAKGRKASK